MWALWGRLRASVGRLRPLVRRKKEEEGNLDLVMGRSWGQEERKKNAG